MRFVSSQQVIKHVKVNAVIAVLNFEVIFALEELFLVKIYVTCT